MADLVKNQSRTGVTFSGFACPSQGCSLEHHQYEPKALGDHDVEVAITHCGICHSDLHLIDNDWGISKYPFIPGHEIIGTVREKGKGVKHLKIGDRVGIGWQCGSCLTCELCCQGFENLCKSSQPVCVGRNGGFANGVRVDGRFAFLIPEALESENAAPLLCGGATVYSPFVEYHVKATDRVAIIGIGGLGHMAIQFANAMGCDVTAISHTRNKEEEAYSLGAHHFIDSSDPSALERAKGSFDFIMTTVFVDLNWQSYVEMLRPNGTFCFVGASQGPLNVLPNSLLSEQRRIVGSVIGGRYTIMEMLAFAARHDIQAMTELFPIGRVNDALDRLRNGDIRYRAVLKI
jgi:uncharacterized zinc-type alcohol dehydrogenase-like protein